jgi:hypothetical protein
MIVKKTSNYVDSRFSNNSTDMIRPYDADISDIVLCLQGRVRFGDGTSNTNGENVYGKFLQITTNGSANTESTFTHNMGTIPVGYIVLWQSIAGSIYQGPTSGTAWTTTTISLIGSANSINALLFLLK